MRLLLSSKCTHKVQAGSFGKCAKVPVSGKEGDASIHTTLGDQRVAKARLRRLAKTFARNAPALCQYSGAISISGTSERVWATLEGRFGSLREFGEHEGRHEHLPVFQRPIEPLRILACISL